MTPDPSPDCLYLWCFPDGPNSSPKNLLKKGSLKKGEDGACPFSIFVDAMFTTAGFTADTNSAIAWFVLERMSMASRESFGTCAAYAGTLMPTHMDRLISSDNETM